MGPIINQIMNLPPEVWQMLLVGVIASPAVQVVKHFLDWCGKWAEGLLAFFALVGSLVVYTINSDPLLSNQVASIMAQMGLVGITAKPVYYIFIKGLWQGVILENFGAARKLNAELKSAQVPAEGLPLEAQGNVVKEAVAQPADFS